MTKLGKWPRRKLLNPIVKERKRESRGKGREEKGGRRIEEAGGENEMVEGVCTCDLDAIGAAPSSSASASEAANTCTKGNGTVTKPAVRAEGVSYLLQQLSLLLLG